MKEIILPYSPHPGQQLVHSSIAKWKVLKCGRRWGKGRCSVMEMIEKYLEWMYEPRVESLIPQIQMMVVGPTFEATDQPWMELQAFVRPLEEAGLVKKILQDEKKIFLWLPRPEPGAPEGECKIEVKSADKPTSILGRGIDMVWVTEAPYIENVVWNDFILPMLRSPGRKGYALVEGRPESEDSYFERLYEIGQRGEGNIESWLFTTFDNPLVDAEAVWSDAAHMPEQEFRKEYLAETLGDSYSAFRNVNACLGGVIEEPRPGVVYVIGIDLGKAVDWTACVVGERMARKVVNMERFSRISWTEQKQRIINLSQRYNNAAICMDTANVGSAICDDLRQAGLKILAVNTHSPKEKARIIDSLSLAFEKQTITIPNDRITLPIIGECKVYRKITQSKTGLLMKNPQLRAPYGKHDDCVMALALCVNLFQRTGSAVSVKPVRFGRGF